MEPPHPADTSTYEHRLMPANHLCNSPHYSMYGPDYAVSIIVPFTSPVNKYCALLQSCGCGVVRELGYSTFSGAKTAGWVGPFRSRTSVTSFSSLFPALTSCWPPEVRWTQISICYATRWSFGSFDVCDLELRNRPG